MKNNDTYRKEIGTKYLGFAHATICLLKSVPRSLAKVVKDNQLWNTMQSVITEIDRSNQVIQGDFCKRLRDLSTDVHTKISLCNSYFTIAKDRTLFETCSKRVIDKIVTNEKWTITNFTANVFCAQNALMTIDYDYDVLQCLSVDTKKDDLFDESYKIVLMWPTRKIQGGAAVVHPYDVHLETVRAAKRRAVITVINY